MDIPVIYEDDTLWAIDKPAGVVVNKATSVKSETIQDWAEKRLKADGKSFPNSQNNEFSSRSGIVHRIDKETSGLLLIAKTPEVFENLQLQFKERKITKKYLTLVHGEMESASGDIKASVGRLPWNRERFGVLAGGREALTSYRLLKSFSGPFGETLSYLEVTPHTGRTHQIRIHLKYLGHPVVSDFFYAGRKTAKRDLKFCPRLFLHAAYIKFAHAKDGKVVELSSALPSTLEKVLENLK